MSTQVIILAGGKGKRMGGNIPKVLVSLCGKPLIAYVLDAVSESGVCQNPVIVVGYQGERVREALGDKYQYIVQKEQLGTGHAVSVCREKLQKQSENIFVLYGDMPFISPGDIQKILSHHLQSGSTLTMGTVVVNDFFGWKEVFYSYGRIIRDHDGNIFAIVELKDCSGEQKHITEVNPGYYCFRSDWLWENIHALSNQNAQNEYYLTDLVQIAIEQKEKVSSVRINPKSAYGINTQKHLETAEFNLKKGIFP